ncbi:hypothetical protein HA402_006465 [Bradysia odoriphaga]|nr:hypothetical protein HA402_006465 [Bradysia odoriphaga]
MGSRTEEKLEKHLKLLKEEYMKLQRNYGELKRKYSKLATASGDADVGEFSSFVSRLAMTVATLHGKTTWREEVLANLTKFDCCSFKLPGLKGLCERAYWSHPLTIVVRSCVRFYCVAEEVESSILSDYCSGLISTHWDDLTPQDFEDMSGPLL